MVRVMGASKNFLGAVLSLIYLFSCVVRIFAVVFVIDLFYFHV